MWLDQMADLEASRHSVAIDLPGFGRSDPIVPGFLDAREYADDVAAVIEHFGGPADLVGFSAGAGVVLQVAVRRPDLARSLTLVSAGLRGLTAPRPAGEVAVSGERGADNYLQTNQERAVFEGKARALRSLPGHRLPLRPGGDRLREGAVPVDVRRHSHRHDGVDVHDARAAARFHATARPGFRARALRARVGRVGHGSRGDRVPRGADAGRRAWPTSPIPVASSCSRIRTLSARASTVLELNTPSANQQRPGG